MESTLQRLTDKAVVLHSAVTALPTPPLVDGGGDLAAAATSWLRGGVSPWGFELSIDPVAAQDDGNIDITAGLLMYKPVGGIWRVISTLFSGGTINLVNSGGFKYGWQGLFEGLPAPGRLAVKATLSAARAITVTATPLERLGY